MINKKIIKFLVCFIPNKNLRKKLRANYNEYLLKKQLVSLENGEEKIKLEEIKKEFPKVLTIQETLNEILENKQSIARFGDGEFNLLLDNKKAQNIFQTKNNKLKERLIEVLNSQNKKLIVCITPIVSKEYSKILLEKEPKFWERYWLAKWEEVKEYFKVKKIYGNAMISRVDVFYECQLEEIKKIWENKDIVFVYSKEGRFEKRKELFDNIKSSKEIFVPAKEAFNSYEIILEECKKESKEKLFLLAIGATATILAYDLTLEGYQALDIGHFPNSYQEYLGEITSPESLPIVK